MNKFDLYIDKNDPFAQTLYKTLYSNKHLLKLLTKHKNNPLKITTTELYTDRHSKILQTIINSEV